MMNKSQTIDAIVKLNPTAQPDFLSGFANDDLSHYLNRLAISSVRLRDQPSDDVVLLDEIPLDQTPTKHNRHDPR